MNLKKELARNIRNHAYEETESGMLFPKAKLAFENYFTLGVNDADFENFPNLMVDEFRTAALDILFNEATQPTAFYLAPYAGNVTPTSGWTAANFAANATEFTNYTESTRQAWDTAAAANFETTSSTFSIFTVDNGAQDTIWGVGVLTVSSKSGTTGLLVAANKGANARSGLVETDKVNIGYTVSLVDATV